ncbi:MAG: hypothetical protein Q8R00_04750 [Candidatus Nanoarchaeia archaeon]|nr:hypothetical protein [Candidatus Nanoarchaeia archaeon]
MSDNTYKSIYESKKALDRLDRIEERFNGIYIKNPMKALIKNAYFTSVRRRINALSTLRSVLEEALNEYNLKAVAQMSQILEEVKRDRKTNEKERQSRLPRSIAKIYEHLRTEIEEYKLGKVAHIVEHLESLDDRISDEIMDGKPRESIDSEITDFMLVALYGLPKSNDEGRTLSLKFSNKLERYDEMFMTIYEAEQHYDFMGGEDGESTRN